MSDQKRYIPTKLSKGLPGEFDQLLVRLPREMGDRLRSRAASRKKSLNRVMVEMIAEKLGYTIGMVPVEFEEAWVAPETSPDEGR